MISPPRSVSRRALFATFCTVGVVIAVVFVMVRQRSMGQAPAIDLPSAENLSRFADRRGLLFSSSAFDSTNGTVGLSLLETPEVGRYRTDLRCERVHFGG